jgi:Peptidase family S41/N-terminal domain of Peptidase_S41 in eukaryotic IRBP
MSEKIYALLLRLFPSHFREAYGEEALQLFRDRAGDEKGFFPGLRLWLDLLSDLVWSVPREYFHVQPALIGASAYRRLDGLPLFFILEDESPRLGALLLGSAFSLAAVSTIFVLISQVGSYHPFRPWTAQAQRSATALSSAFKPPAAQAVGDAGEKTTASGSAVNSETSVTPGDAARSDTRSNVILIEDGSESCRPQTLPSGAQSAVAVTNRVVNGDATLDAAERHRVIVGAIVTLKEHYVYPDVAQKMAGALLAREKSGEDDKVTEGRAFAAFLTRQMREVSPDKHLELVYSQEPLPQHPTEPTAEELAHYREAMERQNCTFEKVEILPSNIGYLKLNSFPDPSVCRQTATAAMASVNHADAIIFDLRENRGGEPEMVALMASYLFDHPEYWYNPRENTTQKSWTRSPVPGNRLADKPVYILTSARTFSGAEQFCYDLKMLKRTTLIGETTGGGAHAGVFHRIDDHFGMGIPEAKPINPYSKSDWAETGVDPDVKVKAADALETAVKLARSRVPKK